MFNKELFRKDPRSYTIDLLDQGLVDERQLLLAAIQYMSHDDVRSMLNANELSPSFIDEYQEEE